MRYGDQPETRERLQTAIDNATDQARVKAIVRDDLLVPGLLDTRKVLEVRAQMERYNARKLQPHFIRAFFLEALNALNGSWHERESGRYAINSLPYAIRQHAREKGLGPIARKYERICFDKRDIRQQDKPDAEFVCPSHPLLDAVISLLLERQRHILTRGAVLIDPRDPGDEPRVLITLESAIHDALPTDDADYSVIAREARFIEIDSAGAIQNAGSAPYLDYRPAEAAELAKIKPMLRQDWLKGEDLEARALSHARRHLVPPPPESHPRAAQPAAGQDPAGGAGAPHARDLPVGRGGGTAAATGSGRQVPSAPQQPAGAAARPTPCENG